MMGYRHAVSASLLFSAACAAICSGSPPVVDHVVVLVLENRGYQEIIGSPDAPYLNSLAQGGAFCTNFFALTHPSQPNYFEFFGGSNQDVQDNANPPPGAPFESPNLGSSIMNAGRTFTSYSEALPFVGFTGPTAGNFYTRLVNPCASWQATNPGTNQLPPTVNRPFSDFPTWDFSQLPTVSFVVPTIAHSMHNNNVASGDAWVQTYMGAYADWAMANNSLLIVTFDEDNGVTRNRIPTIFYGPMVRLGQIESFCTQHDLLRTICDLYGAVPPGKAAGAHSIPGIFAENNLAVRRVFQQGNSGYNSAHDSWLHSSIPNESTSATTYLNCGAGRQVLLRYDNLFGTGAARVPQGATILSAKLTLMVGGDRSRDAFSMHRMLVPWTDTSTWNSLGAGVSTDDTEAASVAEFETIPNVAVTPAVFDVTGAVQAWSDGTSPNYGFLLHAPGTDMAQFYSSEYAQAADRPVLEITYDGGAPCVTFTQQPHSQSVVRGSSAVFTAPATSPDPLSYRWRRNGQPLSDGGGYAGTETDTLTVSPADFQHAGTYSLQVTASCTTLVSNNATLLVTCDVVPEIAEQPPSILPVPSGQTATISVSVSAPGSVQYRWQRSYSDDFEDLTDGANISGSETTTLVIAAAGAMDSANYRLLAFSDCSVKSSTSCFLDVHCHADVNNDGFVSGEDFDVFVQAFVAGDIASDYDGNTFVNGDDFDTFMWDFVAGC